MPDNHTLFSPEGVGVSLVGGNSAVRHARQLMLRSERYDVRSYPTSAALLADPRAFDYPCIILDLELEEVDGADFMRQMRTSGWRGKALILDAPGSAGAVPPGPDRHGDTLLPRTIGNQSLLNAIAASIDHSWAGWNAVG